MSKILSIIYQTKFFLNKNSIKAQVINNIDKVFNNKNRCINSTQNKPNTRYQQTNRYYYYCYKKIRINNRRMKNVN